MKRLARMIPLRSRFLRDDSGAALVEFAIVVSLFFFIFFSIFDFGRFFWTTIQIEKATQIAARIAVARPAACETVPTVTDRIQPPPTVVPPAGTSCDAFLLNDGSGTQVCAAVNVTCTGGTATAGTAAEDTHDEIWARISALLPAGTTEAAIEYNYRSDPEMGFIGGPLVPIVTVTINPPNFQFVAPIAGLAFAASNGNAGSQTSTGSVPYREFSVSLPGEDLAHGI